MSTQDTTHEPLFLTASMLADVRACSKQVELFRSLFPTGVCAGAFAEAAIAHGFAESFSMVSPAVQAKAQRELNGGQR
jgi:hypothetical protein